MATIQVEVTVKRRWWFTPAFWLYVRAVRLGVCHLRADAAAVWFVTRGMVITSRIARTVLRA